MPHNGILSRFAFQSAEPKKTATGIAYPLHRNHLFFKYSIGRLPSQLKKISALSHNYFSPFLTMQRMHSFSET